jgi:pilus assembly protein Flp/PilA
MKSFLKTLWRQEDAATAVEYAVMLALILIAVIGAIGSVGAQTGGMWGDIDNELTTVGFGS